MNNESAQRLTQIIKAGQESAAFQAQDRISDREELDMLSKENETLKAQIAAMEKEADRLITELCEARTAYKKRHQALWNAVQSVLEKYR